MRGRGASDADAAACDADPARPGVRRAGAGDADRLGLGEEIGGIAPGWCADLTAVAGNPAIDIGALRNVRLVLRGGMVAVDRRDAGAAGTGVTDL
jgi:cytosine/adenosine deaminase-related metal-dependent hydrolase